MRRTYTLRLEIHAGIIILGEKFSTEAGRGNRAFDTAHESSRSEFARL